MKRNPTKVKDLLFAANHTKLKNAKSYEGDAITSTKPSVMLGRTERSKAVVLI